MNKQIEKNNTVGKTRDVFKKIEEIKETFHTRMGMMKDRSSKDLTEAEEIKKWYREGNSNPLQYSCLENPMDRGAWWAAVHGVAESQTRLSNFIFTFMHWRRKWQPTPVFLPGESQGQGSLVGCRLWGRTESDAT